MRNFVILVYFLFVTSSPVLAQLQSQTLPMDESAWAKSFEDVKAQIKGLLATNDRLNAEYKSLQEEIPRMQKALDSQGAKNDELRRFINERHGKTDQQVRVEELSSQIKIQKPQLVKLQIELDDLNRVASKMRKVLSAKQSRISDWDLHQNKNSGAALPAKKARRSGDAELDALRKDLEEQREQEVQLESQISSNTTTQVEQKKIDELEAKLVSLKEQRSLMEKAKTIPVVGEANQANQMVRHRAELEAKIVEYEKKINAFKGVVSTGLLWGAQKKQLIKDIVQADAKNQQMRSKIGNLREDVGVLRDQIARLQNKLNFSQGKGKKRL